jgi:hypothetical protein
MEPKHECNIIGNLNDSVNDIVINDFIRSIEHSAGWEIRYMKISSMFSMSSALLTGVSSIMAFSAGFFDTPYVSYIAGCTGVLSVVFMKMAYYTTSQSHYYDNKIKSLVTKEYQYLYELIKKQDLGKVNTISPTNI